MNYMKLAAAAENIQLRISYLSCGSCMSFEGKAGNSVNLCYLWKRQAGKIIEA
jgi:hypothetical protein